MNENRNSLITAAGIIIFLFAGAFMMLLSPKDKEYLKNNERLIEISKPAENKTAEKISEPEKPKPDWYVYVIGEVKNPGYYKISADTRVFHAIEKAGGFTKKADQTAINMAEFLADGITINVAEVNKNKNSTKNIHAVKIPGMQAANVRANAVPPVTFNAQPKTAQNTSGLIDINSATEKELEQLKGVGPAIAKRIVEYRTARGKFSSPEDLINVKGIGSAKLEKMRPQILIR
ncbi:MAG: helix-hairpin-helix domain-containing protein [Synergistaceae bacterium]|nr:helix-hairpin-helix domain-containing protein [Synergistaceae bacterium]